MTPFLHAFAFDTPEMTGQVETQTTAPQTIAVIDTEEVQTKVTCKFGERTNVKGDCEADTAFITKIRNLTSDYTKLKKWLMDEFVNLGTDHPSSQNGKIILSSEEGSDNDNQVGDALADRNYLSRGHCVGTGSDCLMTKTKFLEDDAGRKGVEIAAQKIKEISGSSGAVSSSKYPSDTFAQCVKVFGGDNQVHSRQSNNTAWFKTSTLPASIDTVAGQLNAEINSPDSKKYLSQYGQVRNALKSAIESHESKSTEQAVDLIKELENDQNHEGWIEYIKDRVKIGAADQMSVFLRSCDAAFYLTSFEDPLIEEAEDKHTSGPGAYGVITCKNPSALYTQDYGYCVNVATAYDVYTVMEVAAKQGAQIAGNAVLMTGQAQAMQTASVNPTDPTLQLFELKKQAQASAYTATGESVIQAAMGAYLLGVSKKFWTLEDFVNKCNEHLPQNSAFTASVYKKIIGNSGQVKNCSTPDSCSKTLVSNGAHRPSALGKSDPVIVLHQLFLKSWDFIKTANDFIDHRESFFLLDSLYAKKDEQEMSSINSAEATAEWSAKVEADAAAAGRADYNGEKRVATSPDSGDCSGLDPNDYKKYFCEQILSYDHCSVAANELIGVGILAPNDHVKAVAQSIATQALAKTLVSGAAAAAYYLQVANVQKMIDGINDKMEGVDMDGIAADLLTIQECQMNPSLPQCGGVGFADGEVGFGSGFGSINMDAGSSTTMGSSSGYDSATSDGASSSSDTGESLSGSGSFQSFAGTDADEAAAARAGIKDSSASGGGSGGGAGSSPGAPGGSGGGKSPGAAGGSGTNSFGKNLTGTFGFGTGSTWGGGTGRKSSTGLDDALKGNARTGSVLDYRGPAGIGDDSVDIWKRISKGYNKAITNKRLLEYVEE